MKKLSFSSCIIPFALTAALSACDAEEPAPPQDAAIVDGAGQVDQGQAGVDGGTGGLSFETDVRPIMDSRCKSCHSFATTYSNVKAQWVNTGLLRPQALERHGGLTQAEADTIVQWIDEGAAQ